MMNILGLRDISWLLLELGWTALALLFAAELRPRDNSWPVNLLAVFICAAVPVLVRYFSYPTIVWDLLLNLAVWMAAYLLLTRENWKTLFFGVISLMVIRELTLILSHDMLVQLVLVPLIPGISINWWNFIHTCVSLSVGLALVLLFRPWIYRHDKQRFGIWQMALILLPFLAYAYARQLYFYMRDASIAVIIKGFNFRMGMLLVLIGFCVIVMAILADNILSTKLQQEELRQMEAILRKQRDEYLMQKAASDAVRQKYHDLKNYIIALRAEQSSSGVQERLAGQLEELLRPISASQNTGNEFLDVILTDKIEAAQEKGLTLVPFVDGRGLEFIDGLDLCVIVGNALDNAIEAAVNLPSERRQIHIKICTVHNMALFTVQNYFNTPISEDENGLIKTSKRDEENHGYGLKGIRQAVYKYGGTVSVKAEDDTFTLSILIPNPQ